jgi:hypothetical protein
MGEFDILATNIVLVAIFELLIMLRLKGRTTSKAAQVRDIRYSFEPIDQGVFADATALKLLYRTGYCVVLLVVNVAMIIYHAKTLAWH